MIAEDFINNILTGVRNWVNSRLDGLVERIRNIEAVMGTFDELTYSEQALYTNSSDGATATGSVTRIGHMVHLYVTRANVMNDWRDMYFRLPYNPDEGSIRIVNDRGIYQSGDIYFKVSFTTVTINNTTYPAIKLNRYVDGQIRNWSGGQNVSFKVDYITDED